MFFCSQLNIEINNNPHATSNCIISLLANFHSYKNSLKSGIKNVYQSSFNKENIHVVHFILNPILNPFSVFLIFKNFLKSAFPELSLTLHYSDVHSTKYLRGGHVRSRFTLRYGLCKKCKIQEGSVIMRFIVKDRNIHHLHSHLILPHRLLHAFNVVFHVKLCQMNQFFCLVQFLF